MSRQPKISMEAAGKKYEELRRPPITVFYKLLVEDGTPVALNTLHKWLKQGWKPKVRSNLQVSLDRKTKKIEQDIAKLGTSDPEIEAHRQKYLQLADAELLIKSARNAFVTANIAMDKIQESFDNLSQLDPSGLANLMSGAAALLENAYSDVERSVDITTRVLRIEDQNRPSNPKVFEKDDPLSEQLYNLGLKRLTNGGHYQ